MKVSEENLSAAYVIQSYSADGIKVGAPAKPDAEDGGPYELITLEHSFIISPGRLIDNWTPATMAEVTAADLAQVTALNPELVLFGTGGRMQFPAPELLVPLYERGTGFEVMTTAAACRTYNILAGEGRKVAAALLVP